MLKITGLILVLLLTLASVSAQNIKVARPVKTSAPANSASEYVAPPARSTVRGRVYFEDTGRPVRRSSIMLLGRGGGGGESSALTDNNGNFVMQNVAAGTYYAVVNAPGVVSPLAYLDINRAGGNLGDEDFEGESGSSFGKIIVDGVNEVQAEVAAKRGGAVSGRIIYENGDPAVGVRVEVLRKTRTGYTPVFSNLSSIIGLFTGGGAGNGQTDDRGMYRFSGLPTGEYIVRVSENAVHTDTPSITGGGPDGMLGALFGHGSLLTFYYPDKTEESEAGVINVLMGQELSEINVTVFDKSVYVLSGKVISGRDKKPLAGAKVLLQRKGAKYEGMLGMIGRDSNRVMTGEDGEWKFKDLPKGEYTVTVEPDNRDEEFDDDAYASNLANTASPAASAARRKPRTTPKYSKRYLDIALDDADSTGNVIELGPGATIFGSVTVLNSSKPLPPVSVTVTAETADISSNAQVGALTDDEKAAGNVRRAPNEFKLENVAPGKGKLTVHVGDDDYYVKSVMSGMRDLLTSPLELREGEVVTGVKIILAADAGTLKGKITGGGDLPAANVSVLIVPADAAKRNAAELRKAARTDAVGVFEVKLPPGEYAVLIVPAEFISGQNSDFDAWLEEAMKSPDKVTIDPEKTSTITLKRP